MAIKQTAAEMPWGSLPPNLPSSTMMFLSESVEPRGPVVPSGPFSDHCDGPDGAGTCGYLVPTPPDDGKKERGHPVGDCGDPDPRSILRRLAQSMGSFPHGKRGMG